LSIVVTVFVACVGEIDTRLLTKNGRIQIAKDIKKSGMITSAIQQIVNTDRAELKDFLNV
jgi:hypothetical protein